MFHSDAVVIICPVLLCWVRKSVRDLGYPVKETTKLWKHHDPSIFLYFPDL